METRAPAARRVTYNDFEADSWVVREADGDSLILFLPGFKKEQLSVQLSGDGVLKITGERPLEGKRKSRFRKEWEIPEECVTSQISALFEDNKLIVRMPKPPKPDPSLEEAYKEPSRGPPETREEKAGRQSAEKGEAAKMDDIQEGIHEAENLNSDRKERSGGDRNGLSEGTHGAGPELGDSSMGASKKQKGGILAEASAAGTVSGGSEAGGGLKNGSGEVGGKCEKWVNPIVLVGMALLLVHLMKYIRSFKEASNQA